jgi:isochorismate hydrolase
MTKEEQEKIDEINAKYSDWLLTKYQDFGQFNHSDLKQEQNIQISPID